MNLQRQFDAYAFLWARTIARHLPQVTTQTDIASLEIMTPLHQHEFRDELQLKKSSNSGSSSTCVKFWTAVAIHADAFDSSASFSFSQQLGDVDGRYSAPWKIQSPGSVRDWPHQQWRPWLYPGRVCVSRDGQLPLFQRRQDWWTSAPARTPLIADVYQSRRQPATEEARFKELEAALLWEVVTEKKASKAFTNAVMENTLRLLEEKLKTAQVKEEELE